MVVITMPYCFFYVMAGGGVKPWNQFIGENFDELATYCQRSRSRP